MIPYNTKWYGNRKVLNSFIITMYKLGFWDHAFNLGGTFNYIQIYATKRTDEDSSK